ncbi:MAG TPA: hypothetical protein VJX67_01115 [Blastocatellia bacterium]|nr:hypothetical protein [Blastocatellia bacterium]
MNPLQSDVVANFGHLLDVQSQSMPVQPQGAAPSFLQELNLQLQEVPPHSHPSAARVVPPAAVAEAVIGGGLATAARSAYFATLHFSALRVSAGNLSQVTAAATGNIIATAIRVLLNFMIVFLLEFSATPRILFGAAREPARSAGTGIDQPEDLPVTVNSVADSFPLESRPLT